MNIMQASERGIIETLRRDELSLYQIITEILGNINGSQLVISVSNGYLNVFQNDGGLSDEDREAVTMMYQSGENDDTASLNGIGIRRVFDRICRRYVNPGDPSITLTHRNTGDMETYNFYFHEDPLWAVSEPTEPTPDATYHYQSLCSAAGLDPQTLGTMWRVPLSEQYRGIFHMKSDDIQQIIRRFFNRRIMSGGIHVLYNGHVVSVQRPLCDTNQAISCELELWYDGLSSRSTRYIKVRDYPQLCLDHPGFSEHLHETMNMNDPGQSYQTGMGREQTHIETISVKMLLYDEQDFEGVKTQYEYGNNRRIKGVWLYLSEMCLLQEPIMRNGPSRDYMQADYCPIIDLQVDRSTILFRLSGDKTSSRENSRDGTRFLKFVWKVFYLLNGCPNPTPSADPVPPVEPVLPVEPEPNAPGSADRSQIPYQVHMEIWKRRFGMSVEGPCICCQNTIGALSRGHEIGHIQPVCRGGTSEWQNIIPICRTCNSNMANTHMRDWMEYSYPNQYERYLGDMSDYIHSPYP
jgi:hypothetical protein